HFRVAVFRTSDEIINDGTPRRVQGRLLVRHTKALCIEIEKRTEIKEQACACCATITQITFLINVQVSALAAGELVIYALTDKFHSLTELFTMRNRRLPCSPQSYPQV